MCVCGSIYILGFIEVRGNKLLADVLRVLFGACKGVE